MSRFLTLGGMLKAAVCNSLQQFWLQHQLLEPGGVNAHVALLLLSGLGGNTSILLLHLLLLAANCAKTINSMRDLRYSNKSYWCSINVQMYSSEANKSLNRKRTSQEVLPRPLLPF